MDLQTGLVSCKDPDITVRTKLMNNAIEKPNPYINNSTIILLLVTYNRLTKAYDV